MFDGDPWPYGIEANRPTLEALVTYLAEQNLIAKTLPIEEFFVPIHGLALRRATMRWRSISTGLIVLVVHRRGCGRSGSASSAVYWLSSPWATIVALLRLAVERRADPPVGLHDRGIVPRRA